MLYVPTGTASNRPRKSKIAPEYVRIGSSSTAHAAADDESLMLAGASRGKASVVAGALESGAPLSPRVASVRGSAGFVESCCPSGDASGFADLRAGLADANGR